MHPEAGEGLAGEAFGLGDFVFVVGEDEVDAAGVDIEGGAEILDGHDGTFDVPTGATGADFGIPGEFAFLRSFPEGEVAGVGLFVLVDIDAGAGDHAAEVVVGELAIFGEFADAEVDGTVAAVGEAVLLQFVDGGGHLGDVFGGAGDAFGAFEAERGAVVEEGFGVDVGVFAEAFALGDGVADDFVVDVGDVHDVIEFVAIGAQPAPKQVIEDEGAEVADVGKVVDGGTAGVHSDGGTGAGAVEGLEWLDLLGQRVIETQGHEGKLHGISAGRGGGGWEWGWVGRNRVVWAGFGADFGASGLFASGFLRLPFG